ncbi:MAG: CoA transferase [Deltaproteobacteria bacterium]|nr:MAG: CoA transferase [Deltaproteobacteria bacterium]
MDSNIKRSGFLENVHILDLADEKADFCTTLLADMGARVIKVEKPGGDASRKRGPFCNPKSSSKNSLPFYYNNTNKHGITLDIERREGQSIFLKLVKKTDVLVETFPPGYLKRIGMDYETLSGVNSKLILVSVTGFGQNGPRRGYKTCDLVASAYGGQMYVSGSPSAAPLKAFGDQSYYSASLFAATGILLALRNRAKTKKGDHIDISLQASVTATLEHVMVRYFSERIIPGRRKSLHWNDDFIVLPCKDGFMQVTIFQKWETLIEWLDTEGMAEDLMDEKWLDEDYRRKHLWHVIEILQKWTSAHTIDEIFELAQLMRFPWAPVQSPNVVLDCPQLNTRNFFVKRDYPPFGIRLKYPGIPYKISKEFDHKNKPAPLPGEHNRMIYRQEIGISEKTLKRLYCQKVI